MASHYERQVAFELAGVELLLVVASVRRGEVPPPRNMLGVALAFAGLSLFELGSEPWQKTGALIGLLILLAMGVSLIPAQGGQPDLLTWVTGMVASPYDLFPGGSHPRPTEIA